jgi:MFS family permease
MLLFSPIVAATSIYVAISYGILYLLFTTFTFVFSEQYGFSTSIIGLTFVPLGIGMILALFIMGFATDRIIKGKQTRGEKVLPEDRIPVTIVGVAAVCLPIGLFIYGWTTQNHIHWIVPMLGNAVSGFGLLIIFVSYDFLTFSDTRLTVVRWHCKPTL